MRRLLVTDREAGEALVAPQPEPFRQVRWTHEDYVRYDEWNRRRIAAMIHFGYRP